MPSNNKHFQQTTKVGKRRFPPLKPPPVGALPRAPRAREEMNEPFVEPQPVEIKQNETVVPCDNLTHVGKLIKQYNHTMF